MTRSGNRTPATPSPATTHITWDTSTVAKMERLLIAAVIATREDGVSRYGLDAAALEQALATVTDLLDTVAAHGWIMTTLPRTTRDRLTPIHKVARARLHKEQ